MLLGIDHVCILVRDLEEAKKNFTKALNTEASETYHFPERGHDLVLLSVGDSKLEISQPANMEWIDKHGEGIIHICLEVDDILKTMEKMSEKGISFRFDSPKEGVTGKVNTLIEPINGVSIEFVEKWGKESTKE